MKNKDAIEILETMAMAESTFSDEESKNCCEAIDIAIKALKREEAKCDVPLTLEQLRKIDGKPVWVEFTGSKIERESGWFILKYMTGQEAHLVGKVNTYKSYEYYGKTWVAYAYPPAHIDLEAWTAEWEEDGECNHKPYRVRDAEKWKKYKCSKCGYKAGRRANQKYCPSCGRAMTSEALAELEKRIRGVRAWQQIGVFKKA